jgi:sarcosine oxidase subunit beta
MYTLLGSRGSGEGATAERHSVHDILPQRPDGTPTQQATHGAASYATAMNATRSPASAHTCDVLIVGAGIIGLNIALQIARRSTLRVIVVERGAAVGEGSTGASSAVCRFRYSLDEVTCLAHDGVQAYRHWSAYTGLAEPRAQFQQDGVLWMPGDEGWAPREHARMSRLGLRSEVIDADETRRRFPALSTCTRAPDLETGEAHACTHGGLNFLEVEGGYMDPVSAAQDLVDACRAGGVEVRFRAPVSRIVRHGGRVSGAHLADGSGISCATLINAAGPWCNALYAEAGLASPWPLVPTRIQVLHRDRPAALEGHIPVTVDMRGGIYFRTQNRGQQLIVSSVLEEDEREAVADPDDFPRYTDTDFELAKLHALHHRLPALDTRSRVTGYCGLYTVNLEDVHPVLGPTAVEGFWVANGFSGHGFKLAPAIGAILARELTGNSDAFDTQLPMAFLAVDREPIALDSKSVLA